MKHNHNTINENKIQVKVKIKIIVLIRTMDTLIMLVEISSCDVSQN